ncbi:NACHT domain-containing protein [Arthrobacter sp. efr-133-R2A-63]|uniref:NACHT domain-containing protein n=1 Tax=Arthrobacter sp. efr-133-R2A-63 TaxID=3040278 RepID=UPI00255097A5|nr:NACHT domain-containing protein [Arthrobacter sp. efr-133-R2A-63]
MDPATAYNAVKTIKATAKTAKAAADTFRSAVRRLRLAGAFDPQWIDLSLANISDKALTAEQVDDIEEFLRASRVRPILVFLALTLLSPPSDGTEEITGTLRSLFGAEVTRWHIDSTLKWKSSWPHLWDRLVAFYGGTLPDSKLLEVLQEELESYTGFLVTPLSADPEENTLGLSYIRRLAGMATDLSSLMAVTTRSHFLAQLIAAADLAPIVSHLDTFVRVDVRKLYIDREFSDALNSEAFDSELLISSLSPFRIVLQGPPGSGKSTFVSHLVAHMAQPEFRNPPLPSVLIVCREYLTSGWTKSFTVYGAETMSASLSTDLSAKEVEALLLTGQVMVVFDGLDEITDRKQRGEMVKRIQAFTRQYPPVSVLVTTRGMGYEQAELDRKLFRHLTLKEFSTPQVQEYCESWFGPNKKGHVESFMRESEQISDLRRNPLLLSLLCNVYGGLGEIPTNRLRIYADCARLLFYKWDADRRIKHPSALPKVADRIMRDVARWFYTENISHKGAKDYVIERHIARFLSGSLGYQEDQAVKSAHEFLGFCAERLWLLSKFGSDLDNDKIYRFTHKTFFEYFTAESLSRSTLGGKSIEADQLMAELILEAHLKDPSSLIPELTLQAYDDRSDGRGSSVYKKLCRMGSPTLLLMRLLDGALLSAEAMDMGLQQAIDEWGSDENLDNMRYFEALMSMHAIARERFQGFHLMEGTPPARFLFLEAWSTLQLVGHDNDLTRSWAPFVQTLASAFREDFEDFDSDIITNWLIREGLTNGQLTSPWLYLWCGDVLEIPGCLWSLMKKMLAGDSLGKLTDGQVQAIQACGSELWGGGSLPKNLVQVSFSCLEEMSKLDLSAASASQNSFAEELQQIIIFIALACSEVGLISVRLLEFMSNFYPGRLSTLSDIREWNAGRKRRPVKSKLDEAERCLERLPEVFSRWSRNEISFVSSF